jgi:L-seryl-tRNA(Ser) seleniumtransferase
MKNRVVLPAGHAVNYGHPIVQDIRLAGAQPVFAGCDDVCSIGQLEDALSEQSIACLLLVSSRLTRGGPISFDKAVAAAHLRGIPVVIDGAAQDMRVGELLATGADLVLISAQKYLRAPTAGLVVGRSELVDAVRAQEKGIGRSMKASKEGILGALAALKARRGIDPADWQGEQARKASDFARSANRISGISASVVPDRAGMPFPRVHLQFEPASVIHSAGSAADYLRSGNPSIWVMEDEIGQDALVLELVPLDEGEINTVLIRLAKFFS